MKAGAATTNSTAIDPRSPRPGHRLAVAESHPHLIRSSLPRSAPS